MNKIAIIILNWNKINDTCECVFSILQGNIDGYAVSIYVVDNGSNNDEAGKLSEKFGDSICVIRSSKNLGFAGGVNLGVRVALANTPKPNYVLLLDNDAIVDKECIRHLLLTINMNNIIGAAAAIVYDYNKSDKIQQSLNSRMDYWRGDVIGMDGLSRIFGIGKFEVPDMPFSLDQYGFWCTLFKTECIEKVGSVDESFFFTWETIDYCERIRQNKYEIVCEPKAKIWHKWRTNNVIDGKTEYYNPRNRFWFMKRYATKLQYTSFLLFFFGIHFWLATAYYLLLKRRFDAYKSFLHGVHDGIIGKA